MNELKNLTNIGGALSKQLFSVGITSVEQLKEVGAKAAWLKILEIDSSACYNKLCSLQGAIQGIRWHYLSGGIKEELKQFYNEIKVNKQIE